MLRSVVADFKDAGNEVTVLLDARLSKLNPPLKATYKVPIFYPKEIEKFLNNTNKIIDSIYIIAPETRQSLQSLVKLAEQTGNVSLNCESDAIGKVTNKAILYKILHKNSFSTPKMLLFNFTDCLMKVKQVIKRELNYPVVLKPVAGIGCSGISVVNEDSQIQKAIDKVEAVSKNANFIVQEFIKGESASISLLSTGKKAQAISLNKQNVNLAETDGYSSYDGGWVPYEHPLQHEAFDLAEKLIESFQGLRGYVGVDLVLSHDKPYVLDVNPRLTTSYVGLRKVVNFNVAGALLNSVLNGKLPIKYKNRDTACFSKIETSVPTVRVFEKTIELDIVVSPPFPLENNTKSCALVIGKGDNLDNARKHLEEAKKNLLTIIS